MSSKINSKRKMKQNISKVLLN